MTTKKIEISVQDGEGNKVEALSVDLGSLGARRQTALLKEAVVRYQANKRVGTHETRTRGEISGSNRKPWRQKGTGRARSGTRKSPLWRGGGIIFGPHSRRYRHGMNRKQRRLALGLALSGKLNDGEVRVVDRIELDEPKTKKLSELLSRLSIDGKCLIGLASPDRNVVLSARNIPGVRVLALSDFNALDVLWAKTVLLTREALEIFMQRWEKESKSPDTTKATTEATTAEEPGGEN